MFESEHNNWIYNRIRTKNETSNEMSVCECMYVVQSSILGMHMYMWTLNSTCTTESENSVVWNVELLIKRNRKQPNYQTVSHLHTKIQFTNSNTHVVAAITCKARERVSDKWDTQSEKEIDKTTEKTDPRIWSAHVKERTITRQKLL